MLDNFEELPSDLPASKPPGHGRLVAAGVVGAMALGAGMGLWARPAPPAPPHTGAMAPEDAPRPALQIIVDDSPAPFGPLLEVLPGEGPGGRETAPPARAPEMVAPRRAAAGLMKVDAVVAAEPLLVPAVKVEAKPEPRTAKAPEKPKAHAARAEPRPEKLKVAAGKATIEKARADRARLAKAAEARAEKLAKAERIERAKADKARAVKLAQAEAKAEKAAKARAETRRLASLVKAAKAATRTSKVEVVKSKAQLAKARDAKVAKVEKASTRTVAAKVVAKTPSARPAPRKPVPVGGGPMRVARNEGCASSDPGAAVVCADRRLGARDRQLQQAYRNAEAAGVPASSLQRQQARWLQARAAAAREAPWAVEDVYEARISELNDLTRDAREN